MTRRVWRPAGIDSYDYTRSSVELVAKLGVVVAIVILAASCGASTGSDTAVAPSVPTAAEVAEPLAVENATSNNDADSDPEPTVAAPEPRPPVPEPVELAEAEMTEAARDAFAASPSDLIAWDEIDAVVVGDRVRLRMCGWTGETVFDTVRAIEFEVVADEQGDPKTTFLSEDEIPERCLNQELVVSAVTVASEYNRWWDQVRDDPGALVASEATDIMTADALQVQEQLAESWAVQGLHWEGHAFPTNLASGAVNEILVRRYVRDNEPVLELLACVEKDAAFGLYAADGSLVNDFPSDTPKQNVIRRYELVRQAGRWLFDGSVESGFNCSDPSLPWLDAINQWKPDPVAWQSARGQEIDGAPTPRPELTASVETLEDAVTATADVTGPFVEIGCENGLVMRTILFDQPEISEVVSELPTRVWMCPRSDEALEGLFCYLDETEAIYVAMEKMDERGQAAAALFRQSDTIFCANPFFLAGPTPG